MMLPTHALVGLAVGAPLLWLAPESATATLVGGLCGGIWPDLDLYVGHRRTLHFPTGYALAAIPAVIVAAVVGSPPAVGLAGGLVAAAAHCRWIASVAVSNFDHGKTRLNEQCTITSPGSGGRPNGGCGTMAHRRTLDCRCWSASRLSSWYHRCFGGSLSPRSSSPSATGCFGDGSPRWHRSSRRVSPIRLSNTCPSGTAVTIGSLNS